MGKSDLEKTEATKDNMVNLVDFSKVADPASGQGLVTTVVQDAGTGKNLMVAFMNVAALEKTLETGMATFWTRSRQKLWTKGEESGNFMKVKRVSVDCDRDAVLLEVEPQGNAVACHTGEESCFYRGFNLDD
jgi:phosphoribosyl-AMP cyclohydrolase